MSLSEKPLNNGPKYQPRRYGKNWEKYEKYLQDKEFVEHLTSAIKESGDKLTDVIQQLSQRQGAPSKPSTSDVLNDKVNKIVAEAKAKLRNKAVVDKLDALAQQQQLTNLLLLQLLGGLDDEEQEGQVDNT